MKHLLIIAVLLCAANGQAQIKSKRIIGNWELTNASEDGKAIDDKEMEVTRLTLHFNDDGTFRATADEKEVFGTWELDGIKLITVEDKKRDHPEGEEIFDVRSATKKELILEIDSHKLVRLEFNRFK